ncbi:hypothetical protein M0813_10963 [Anaeramoeba flamelloides]|uniref:PSI domain-containing protein n=1 Tax=Anaeramoeba flamelloides TaxID=1746091 RepID=A0ABQ8X0W3_9EUKA|nr:hypothetical protein M0813_10963 [Anaeramoeba flamelloides]
MMKNKFFTLLYFLLIFVIIKSDSDECWIHDTCSECVNDGCNYFCDWGFGEGYCSYSECDDENKVTDQANCSSSSTNCEIYSCDECVIKSGCQWCLTGECYNPTTDPGTCTEEDIASDDYECSDPCDFTDCETCNIANGCSWCLDNDNELCTANETCSVTKDDCSVHNCSDYDDCQSCLETNECYFGQANYPTIAGTHTAFYEGRCLSQINTENETQINNQDHCKVFNDECTGLNTCENCTSNSNCNWCQVEDELTCENILFTENNEELCPIRVTICAASPTPTVTEQTSSANTNGALISLIFLLLVSILIIS